MQDKHRSSKATCAMKKKIKKKKSNKGPHLQGSPV